MALNKKIFGKKDVDNTGLNTGAFSKYARFINKDGSPNVHTRGVNIFERYSVFHFFIKLSNWKFLSLIIAFYTIINLIFASVYYLFCIDHLHGFAKGTPLQNFEEAYFFSSQTLTTVGYGRVSPTGFFTNVVASFEALVGILTLALITSLLYGRFVKPKAFIRFSKNALISPFHDGNAIMFRIAPVKNAMISEVSVQATASIMVDDDGTQRFKYYTLPLQFERISTLYTNWTVVHPIDNNSPLFNLTMHDLIEGDFEIIIYVKAFDEDFASTVIARTSYTYNEIVNGAKFISMFYDSEDGEGTIMEMNKLDAYTLVEDGKI